MTPDVEVRGAPTPEEVAAVLAALRLYRPPDQRLSRYERWRRERLAALRNNR